MADFISAGHMPPDPVAEYRDNRLAHWASGDLHTLFSATRAHASLGKGRTPPPTSLLRDGADSMSTSESFHNSVSAKIADRAASLAAVGENHRGIKALTSNSVASGRGVHEELARLHPQDDDDLTDVLPDPISLPRIKLRKASEVVISWRSLLDVLESQVPTSIIGGLKLFVRWGPLALSPV
jgi:hypothetical protein